MKNCPICGTELPDTARFCSHCGHTLITLTPPEALLKSPAAPGYSASRLPTGSPMAQGKMGSAVKLLIVAILAFVLIAGVLIALFTLLGSRSARTDSSPSAVTGTSPNTRVTPTACTGSTGATSSTCSTVAVSPMPIVSRGTVNLTFSGAVIGQMTSTTVVTCGASSSVAGGMQYHLAIFSTVGGQQYALTFGVYPYTGPNTYANSAFSFFGPAGDNSSIAKWRSRLNLGVSVMIHSDGKTGNLDIGYLSSSDNSTGRVAGSWKCV